MKILLLMMFAALIAPLGWAEVNSVAILSKIDKQVSFLDSDFSA